MNAPRIGNAISALNALRQRELDSRRQAVTILQPDEVAGKLSPARMLTTRLGGGGARLITPADLAHFKREVVALGDKARRGLTARRHWAYLGAPDIERAKAQIRYSMPVRLQAGKVHLVTDSGPDSKVTRHHVNVEFALYLDGSVAARDSIASGPVANERIAFAVRVRLPTFPLFSALCCHRWGWVAGRAEHGLPKLTNPTFDGACCKHVVRVMTDVQMSVGLRQRVAQMVEADRARIDIPGKAKPRTFNVTQADAERMLPKNARRIVVPAASRGAKLPPLASAADIQTALKAFAGKRDINSAALTRALQNLLAAQQKAARL